jgi:CHASE1-domain containing sensor protein
MQGSNVSAAGAGQQCLAGFLYSSCRFVSLFSALAISQQFMF